MDVGGVRIISTTNYTPIDYKGASSQVLAFSHLAVTIYGSDNSPLAPVDMFNRMYFPPNEGNNVAMQQVSKVYPELIYLNPGEHVMIEGHNYSGSSSGTIVQLTNRPYALCPTAIRILPLPPNPKIPGLIKP